MCAILSEDKVPLIGDVEFWKSVAVDLAGLLPIDPEAIFRISPCLLLYSVENSVLLWIDRFLSRSSVENPG